MNKVEKIEALLETVAGLLEDHVDEDEPWLFLRGVEDKSKVDIIEFKYFCFDDQYFKFSLTKEIKEAIEDHEPHEKENLLALANHFEKLSAYIKESLK